MKIIALLLALLLGVGYSMKQTANEHKEISFQSELNQYKSQPNLLPVVTIVAQKS